MLKLEENWNLDHLHNELRLKKTCSIAGDHTALYNQSEIRNNLTSTSDFFFHFLLILTWPTVFGSVISSYALCCIHPVIMCTLCRVRDDKIETTQSITFIFTTFMSLTRRPRVSMSLCIQSLSDVWLFVTPWIIACTSPPSMEFSRQEYWSGLHSLLQGILLTQRLNPCLLSLPNWQVISLPPVKPFSVFGF